MVSPGFFGTNQLGGGQYYGLSGQASQALSSNSLAALVGNGISNHAQQLANNVAANNALLQQLQTHYWGNAAVEKCLEPLKTDAIKLGEIIGFRGWRVTPHGFLRSMSADAIWAPGEPMEGKTKSKEEHNGCYAFKKLSDFLKEFGSGGLDVFGKVALWGDIIEHELGYRAQFAKIISLDGYCSTSRPHGIPLKRLRSRYNLQEAA